MATRKNRQIVEKLLSDLGVPSATSKEGPIRQFKNLALVIAILKNGKTKRETLSTLTLNLEDGDSITQTVAPNGDYLVQLRLKHFKEVKK